MRWATDDDSKGKMTMPKLRSVLLAATTCVAMVGLAAPAAQADGQVSDFSMSLAPGRTGQGPDAARLAGGHPDVSTTVSFARKAPDARGMIVPEQDVRDLDLDLPAGLVGNPRLPSCTAAELRERQGACDEATQVGVVYLSYQSGSSRDPNGIFPGVVPLINVQPRHDELARFGFSVLGTTVVTVGARLRDDSDYGVTATMHRATSRVQILDATFVLWGVPADPSHDALRTGPADYPPDGNNPDTCFNIVKLTRTDRLCPSAAPPRPFVTAPTRCDRAQTAKARADSWQAPETWSLAESAPLSFDDCAGVPFDASLSNRPDNAHAGAPAGFEVDMRIPRERDDDPDGRSVSAMRTATVTLPKGVAISPSAADGLQACSDAQLGFGSHDAPTCPDASKVGTIAVESPLVAEPLTGNLYIGTQRSNDPESGEMYRLFVVAEGAGARIKLRGSIKADPRTGQLTATFADNPELPFDRLRLRFMGGDRAPLTNPPTCGVHTTSYTISSWSGKTVNGSDSFTTNQSCSNGRFAPSFNAGTLDPAAGRFSPFTFTVGRAQGDQELAGMAVELPSGLLAALGSVPLCPEPQAATGTCGPESHVGRTTISAGPGAHPFSLGGDVSLGGPYKGAPFSLSIAVDAKAGPFDLGKVVVRSPLTVDAAKGKAGAPADPLPTIIGGVPLGIRAINVTLDRPGFTFNATDCTPRAVNARFTSVHGATAYASSRYQATGCANLRLDPTMAMKFTGGRKEMKKLRNPGLEAEMRQTPGQSGLKTVRVTLPAGVGLDIRHTKDDRICMPEQAAARACPAAAIVGRVEAETIALHEPLVGTVYILKNSYARPDGKIVTGLPKLYLKLDGEGVPLDLIGDTSFASTKGQLTTTFKAVPDAPIRRLRLTIDAGKRGILRSNTDVCASGKGTRVTYDGQNGARRVKTLHVTAPDCRPAIATAKVGPTKLRVRVSGIGPGRVTVKGTGTRKASRTIRLSDAATLKARLTAATRRKLARGQRVKVRVTATYKPSAKADKPGAKADKPGAKAKKAVTLHKTVVVKARKKSKKK